MLKASALYIVIVIAVVIAIFSASLISTAYFYRLELQKNMRYDRLLTNLNSGTAILLSKDYNQYESDMLTAMPGDNSDSIILRKEKWGLYDLASVKSFTLSDTVKKAFFIAENYNDLSAMYVSDEDRPISVSGSTRITGDAIVPKAGIKQAYVEGKPYSGGKELVNGVIRSSSRSLPPLSAERLSFIERWLNDTRGNASNLTDSVFNSFFHEAQVIRISKSAASVSNTSIGGKIILLCDTTLRISRSAALHNVLVFAPAIVIEEGFNGTCQLFARDSIVAGKNTVFNYPSCMGIIKSSSSKIQSKIALGSGSVFSGILFAFEKSRSDLQTQISMGKNCRVKGEVYASGFIKMERPVTVFGKVSCNRFIIQTPTTLYENYLIDITLNRKNLSKYYLSSSLFSQSIPERRILKWLN
ncbi:hypothetical protein ACFSJU_07680 [Paradesertivirga mongoliensis]|uniref:Polymer-forming cytoskeletal protein n=1 Tax=Paradesertivirga mongoliensis TaxID=2100740 RepID=A0ABW4ZK70_9SPHI|nr:hypothetical protein [Pedobacter mongoliensis]